MPKPKNEPLFEEPEFSEEQFLRYEKDRAKSTIFVFLLAIGSGLLEGYLQIRGLGDLSILLFIVLFIGLFKILGILRIKLPVKGSHKFYMLMVFLLASILFWSIALNPPISVNTSPDLSLQISHNGVWVAVNQTNGEYVLTSGPVNYSLRDVISFNANVSYIKTSALVGGAASPTTIISQHYKDKAIYLNLKDLGYLASVKLVTELHSGSKYYNVTQQVLFAQ